MVKMNFEEPMEKKCVYSRCDHDNDEHKNGSCFHITQEADADKPTVKKYCPCGLDDCKNHRLYQDLGYIEPEVNDTMVTKQCIKCEKDLLLNIDEKMCSFCRNLAL